MTAAQVPGYAFLGRGTMQPETVKKLFTVAEYHRMGDAGILDPEERVELIDGEIFKMSPVGRRHILGVIRATKLFVITFGDRAIVSPQNPVRLSDWSEPEPDFVVFKPRSDFYAAAAPTPADVLFLVEISDTTLRHDCNRKLPRYAAAGIPEVWIEDLKNNVLLVYRDPHGDRYETALTFSIQESVSPLAFPDIQFHVHDLLGDPITE
jgi:Uma2 family endonuclease